MNSTYFYFYWDVFVYFVCNILVTQYMYEIYNNQVKISFSIFSNMNHFYVLEKLQFLNILKHIEDDFN